MSTVSSSPQQLLLEHFGFDSFREGQLEVIENLLEGHSAAAVFPTGGGKSLCYQLPTLALPGLTLVVSPLIALMKDQIDALQARGIAAERLDSTLSLEEYHQVVDRLRDGRLTHDRAVARPNDDPVVRSAPGSPIPIRLSRSTAPLTLRSRIP